jgi:hypothetical protein
MQRVQFLSMVYKLLGGLILLLEVVLRVFGPEIRMHLAVEFLSLAQVVHLEELCAHGLKEGESLQFLSNQQLEQVVLLLKGHQVHCESHTTLHS